MRHTPVGLKRLTPLLYLLLPLPFGAAPCTQVQALEHHAAIAEYRTEAPGNPPRMRAPRGNALPLPAVEEADSDRTRMEAPTYNVQRLGVEDGLSSNYVVSVVQDRKGYIWVGTEAGLNRFDGREFEVYTKHGSGLKGNEINVLLPDPVEDKLWIGTIYDGLHLFDYRTGRITTDLGTENAPMDDDVVDLAPASDDGIWVVHPRAGLDRYDRKTRRFTPYTPQNVEGLEENFRTVREDGEGHLYIGHRQQGLSVLDLKDRTVRHFRHDEADPESLPGDDVTRILIDRNNNVWVGTNRGLALFHPQTGKFTRFSHRPGDEGSLLSDQVIDLCQMADGRLWVGTYMGGVSILDLTENAFIAPEKARFHHLTATRDGHGLSGPNARSLLQDTFGNIWIGNYRGGLDFISNSRPLFDIIAYPGGEEPQAGNRQVWGVWADSEGIVLGGEGEIAVYRPGQGWTKVPLPADRSTTHVNTLFRDSRGRYWLGCWLEGVLLYDGGAIRHVGGKEADELDIRTFSEDADGRIWICTQQGLYTYDDKGLQCQEAINALLPDPSACGVYHAPDGNLWVGTTGSGVAVLDRQGRLAHHLTTEEGFPTNALNTLRADSRGRVLVGTHEGLVIIPDPARPESFQVYGADAGLKNTSVRALQDDLDGRLWVSTNGGISSLDETTGRFFNFDYRDGIPQGDFMDNSACLTPDGMVFFGSQQGACRFNPFELATPRKLSPVAITTCYTFDRSGGTAETRVALPLESGKVTLPQGQGTFVVGFNVLDYAQSPHVEFQYMLEGLESTWYDMESDKQVTFRNIPHGRYTFKVRARMRNGVWQEQTAQLKVVLPPPLWLTWYAKTLYILLALLLVYEVVRVYKHRLQLESSLEVERRNNRNEQALNAERLRFYTNITHELRTPLTLILGPIEDLLGDATLSSGQAHKLSLIHESAERLLNLINGLLEFRKTETQNRKLTVTRDDLARLVQETALRYKELNRNEKVTYVIRIDTRETELYFDAGMITSILDNLLSNAAKYTEEGTITVTLSSTEEAGLKYTCLSVADTGHGIDAAELPHIFERYWQGKSKYQVAGSGIGLALVKSLVELHEGQLDVESQPEVGTTFTLRLITENTYPGAVHLPERDRQAPRPATRGQGDTAEEGADERPLLLVVEDNADIRDYLSRSLSDRYEVITAADGGEGWETAQSRIPNVIVSDVMMPVMDGFELCKRVKEDMRTSHIPVILLTARDSLRDKEEGYAAKADSYLTKPFSAKLLLSRIENLLEARRHIAALITAQGSPATHATQEQAPALNPLDDEFLEKLTALIEENLEMERLDVGFLADKMCMSHSTLYRKIKGLTDLSANEFIRKSKMRKAAELLRSGRHAISEIAYLTGFNSTTYFRQCFKEEYGMTPSEYLKRKGL